MGRKAVNKNLTSPSAKCTWHSWHWHHQVLGRKAGSVPDQRGDLYCKEILRRSAYVLKFERTPPTQSQLKVVLSRVPVTPYSHLGKTQQLDEIPPCSACRDKATLIRRPSTTYTLPSTRDLVYLFTESLTLLLPFYCFILGGNREVFYLEMKVTRNTS